jgi:trans-aconitate methyltransferase
MVKKTLDDKLFLAPVGELHRVLDIGTGTGTWCIDMGDQFPSAEILGNDLSPVQPSWVPPNVKFEVDDIESSWAYSRPFDFIFCRTLSCAVGDWPRLMRQAYQHVKPGGWVEFQDFNLTLHSEDGSYKPESDMAKYTFLLTDAARKAGKEASPGPKLEQWVREAGFQNVVHQKYKIPLGPWAKDKQQVLSQSGYMSVIGANNAAEGNRNVQPCSIPRRPRSICYEIIHQRTRVVA